MKKKLEATEMWLLRRSNQQGLQMAGTSRLMMTTIRQRQLRYVGHVLRNRSLAKDCLLGTMERTRARGRQRMKFTDGVKAVVACGNIGEVVRTAEDRARWRYMVANINIQDSARR